MVIFEGKLDYKPSEWIAYTKPVDKTEDARYRIEFYYKKNVDAPDATTE